MMVLEDCVMFGDGWDELMALSHLSATDAIALLRSWGGESYLEDDCLCGDCVSLEDVDLEGDFSMFLGVCGYWSDEPIVIEFKDGFVARWYRGECWD